MLTVRSSFGRARTLIVATDHGVQQLFSIRTVFRTVAQLNRIVEAVSDAAAGHVNGTEKPGWFHT